jgi:hypothetical protein
VSGKECGHRDDANCACGAPAIVLARAKRSGRVAVPPAGPADRVTVESLTAEHEGST